jgi:glycerol-3-phosphate dehydrogenase (NAD(P)+)
MRAAPIAVLGAGALGTALAHTLARARRDVILWGRDAAKMAAMAATLENARYLPGIMLHPNLLVTANLGAVARAGLLIAAAPAQSARSLLTYVAALHLAPLPIVTVAKGMEQGTGLFMCEVIEDRLPGFPAAILSGPSFAMELARGLPTAVTLACRDAALAESIARRLAAPTLRLYHTDDVRGVEIGGSAKNVLAIACGIAAGCGLGASAGAALVARAFAELARFGAACGARPETLTGLSGLGDLVLTCNSPQSRNYALGLALGRGERLADILKRSKLAEGAATARVLVEMARAKGVDMPICEAVDVVLNEGGQVRAAIEALLSRPQKAEA